MKSRFDGYTPRQYYHLARRLYSEWYDMNDWEDQLELNGALRDIPKRYRMAAYNTPRPTCERYRQERQAQLERLTAHHTGRKAGAYLPKGKQ